MTNARNKADAEQAKRIISAGHSKAGDLAESVSSGVAKARDAASETLDQAGARIREGYDNTAGWAGEAYERSARATRHYARQGRDTISQASDRTVEFFEENPLMLGAVGLAGGLLLGALLPRTRSEDRYVGRWRDDLEREGMRYGREAVSHARQYAVDTMRDARRRAEDEVVRAASSLDEEAAQLNSGLANH